MKTISLRELHNNTGKWVRRAKAGDEVTVTDRGEEIAVIVPKKKLPEKKVDWKNRKLVPGFAKYMKYGKMGGTDSTDIISHDRTSRENAVAGIEDDLY